VASIRTAIDAAFVAPLNPKLKERVLAHYIWEKTASETNKAYQMV
jgi:hypothetical protein